MWRVKSLMATDLEKSMQTRLPEKFYGMDSANLQKQKQHSKYLEMLSINRELISYEDVCLPDKVYGGRNVQPEACIENIEGLHDKFFKNANLGADEARMAMTAYTNVINGQIMQDEEARQANHTEEKEDPQTYMEVHLNELQNMKKEFSENITAQRAEIAKHLSDVSALKHSGLDKDVQIEHIKEKLSAISKAKDDLQVQNNHLKESISSMKERCDSLVLAKNDSDLVHRTEADAMRKQIDSLTGELTLARVEVENMYVDIQGRIKDTIDRLTQSFDFTLQEEVERHAITKRRLDQLETCLLEEREAHSAVKEVLAKEEVKAKTQKQESEKRLSVVKTHHANEMNVKKVELAHLTNKYNNAMDDLDSVETDIKQQTKASKKYECMMAKEQQALKKARERIFELETTLEGERKEHQNTKEKIQQSQVMVLTKVKESQGNVAVLKKKLFRAKKENAELQKRLDDSGNVLADRLLSQQKEGQKVFNDLREQNAELAKSTASYSKQMDEHKFRLAEKDSEILKIKKGFEEEVDGVKEQLTKRLERTLSNQKQQQEETKENAHELKKSLDTERQLHQDTKQTLQKQHEMANAQAAELDDAKKRKTIMKRKLFKSTKQIEELRQTHQKTVAHIDELQKSHQKTIIKLQEAQVKNQRTLEDLMVSDEKLKSEKEEERKKNIHLLAEKDKVLKEVNDKLIQQEAIEQNYGYLQNELEALRNKELNAKTKLAEEVAQKDQKVQELTETMKDNERLQHELGQSKLTVEKRLNQSKQELDKLNSALDNLNKEKQNHEKQLNAASTKVYSLEKRLNHREVEIRAKLDEIAALKKKDQGNQATIQKHESAFEKLNTHTKRDKAVIKSLTREKDAHKIEAHTKASEIAKLSKKLNATKEHLATVKKQAEMQAVQHREDQLDKSPNKKKKSKRAKQTSPPQKTNSDSNQVGRSVVKESDGTRSSHELHTGKNKEIKKTSLQQKENTDSNQLGRSMVMETNDTKTSHELHTELPQKAKNNSKKMVLDLITKPATTLPVGKTKTTTKRSRQSAMPTKTQTMLSKQAVVKQPETEEAWSWYDVKLMTFCFVVFLTWLGICSTVSDDPLW